MLFRSRQEDDDQHNVYVFQIHHIHLHRIWWKEGSFQRIYVFLFCVDLFPSYVGSRTVTRGVGALQFSARSRSARGCHGPYSGGTSILMTRSVKQKRGAATASCQFILGILACGGGR